MKSNAKYLITLIFIVNSALNNVIAADHENVNTNQLLMQDNKEFIENNRKVIPYKLQNFLEDLIHEHNYNPQDSYNYVYYNDFTPFSNHIYSYVKSLIDNKIINKPSDIDNIWKKVLKDNSELIKNDKISFYKINSIKEIMDYYVSVRINIIKEEIDNLILKNNAYISKEQENELEQEYKENMAKSELYYFAEQYNDLIDTFEWVQEFFLPDDSIKLIGYTIKQFNFKKVEIIENITKLISNINCINKLNQYEMPLFINKLQNNINNLIPLNIEQIIQEVISERNQYSNKIDYILYYIKTNNNSSEQYIKDYIKECINTIKYYSINNTKENAYNNLQKVLNTLEQNPNFKKFYSQIIKELEIEKVIADYNTISLTDINTINLGGSNLSNNIFDNQSNFRNKINRKKNKSSTTTQTTVGQYMQKYQVK